jgi:hypothetical protein
MYRLQTVCIVIVVSVAMMGCAEAVPELPVGPQGGDLSYSAARTIAGGFNEKIRRLPEVRPYIPAVQIETGDRRLLETVDSALLDAQLHEAIGRLYIALKPRAAPRTSTTGVIPGIQRG